MRLLGADEASWLVGWQWDAISRRAGGRRAEEAAIQRMSDYLYGIGCQLERDDLACLPGSRSFLLTTFIFRYPIDV
jgi:hypothetical protein